MGSLIRPTLLISTFSRRKLIVMTDVLACKLGIRKNILEGAFMKPGYPYLRAIAKWSLAVAVCMISSRFPAQAPRAQTNCLIPCMSLAQSPALTARMRLGFPFACIYFFCSACITIRYLVSANVSQSPVAFRTSKLTCRYFTRFGLESDALSLIIFQSFR